MLFNQIQDIPEALSCPELQALFDEGGYECDDQLDDVFLEYVIVKLAHRLGVMTRTADKLAELFNECLSMRIRAKHREGIARVQLREKKAIANSLKLLEQSSALLSSSEPNVFFGKAMQHGHLRVIK